MENKLQIFTNEQFGSVRIVEKDGEGWLVGKDVAEILGYVNSRDALAKHVDEEDKRVSQIATPSGTQSMTVINESGLYSLILSSKLPKAKEFKRWVTAEVLPTIRKYGVYSTKDFALKAIADPKFAVEIFTALLAEREEKERLQEVVEVKNLQIAEMQPKANYYDLILQSKEAIPVSVIAKDYGLSGKAMNQLLHQLKIQYPCGGTWLVYQDFAAQGYTQTKTIPINDRFSKTHTNWTQKGRLFLYETLKQHGHLPLIEQTEE